MITDVCAEFDDEEILKYSEKDIGYKVPDYNVDKCTVLRAVYYDELGNKSKIEEKIYFVGFDKKSGYDNINIISVTANPDDLFGSKAGIYVLGNEYVQFKEEGAIEGYWAEQYWNWWPGNFRNKGIDWERESNIQVFNTNKELVLSQNAGIRIQGGGSRSYLPKSLNIYAREEYGLDR